MCGFFKAFVGQTINLKGLFNIPKVKVYSMARLFNSLLYEDWV